jgi:tripartite-type tricarboxylate transporter receptor subunit TctC
METASLHIRVGLFAVFLAFCSSALAQPQDAARFPTRPIRIVVGFTPGGQPDIFARLIASRLIEALGQQAVVDNRPGAGGIIGTQIVAEATPDGHTLLSVSAAHVILPAIRSKLPFDTQKDFAGISKTATAAYLLTVAPALNIKSLQELVKLAKARPGQFNFSSAGTGSATHFAAEMLKQIAQIEVVHVPYKGIPESLTDTMTGRVQFTMAPLASSVSLVKEGRLRALAITSRKRSPLYPDIPTIAESGFPEYEWDSWGGILAPAKTPRPIIDKLNGAIVRILASPEMLQRLRALGAEPAPSTPAELDAFIANQLRTIAQIAKNAGIVAQ